MPEVESITTENWQPLRNLGSAASGIFLAMFSVPGTVPGYHGGQAARCLQTASKVPSAPVERGGYFGFREAGVRAELGYGNVGAGGLAQLGADTL
ncbi:hypothetical protein GCM10022407_19600 [Hymenobacter antarcticus]|uniref:Uncharacterized protein n=1 Tax=Hymenobacter antarcticus TaxID=486270 RepID=A0ABP7PZQ1_9BACT